MAPGFQMSPLVRHCTLCRWGLTGPTLWHRPQTHLLLLSHVGPSSFLPSPLISFLGPTFFLVDLRVSLHSYKNWGRLSSWSQKGDLEHSQASSPTMWSPDEALAGVEGVTSQAQVGRRLMQPCCGRRVVSVDFKPSSFFSQCPLWTRLSCVHGSAPLS